MNFREKRCKWFFVKKLPHSLKLDSKRFNYAIFLQFLEQTNVIYMCIYADRYLSLSHTHFDWMFIIKLLKE